MSTVARNRRALIATGGIYIAFAVIVIALALISPAFRSPENLLNIGRQVSVLGLAAFAMTFVILAGEIDLALHWPMPAASGEAALEAAADQLDLGLEADLHPVFGELFELWARPC